MNLEFFKGKRVLVTGHTGFKGTWLSKILVNAGAEVTGYSLGLPTEPSLFEMAGLDAVNDIRGDIIDLNHLKKVFDEFKPQIVFHLAAQPIVRASYKNPVYTYETNVMGTVNVLECIRLSDTVKSAVIITTDKVYKNNEWVWGYRENEPLDGYDPYSNSKSCADLAVHCYRNSFFVQNGQAVSVARAGNVIGGGDFAADRIIPDCVRAIEKGTTIQVRNPYSIRPYQHVLEPLSAYLLIAMKQWDDKNLSGYYNVGPEDEDVLTTGSLVNAFCEKWNADSTFRKASWERIADINAPHEASYLKLDSSKIKSIFGWNSKWHISDALDRTVDIYRTYMKSTSLVSDEMNREIKEFFI